MPGSRSSKYAGVISRESIRILLNHAAMHGTPTWAADIRNAHLQAPTSEKHFIVCGDECGLENAGKKALVTRALMVVSALEETSGTTFVVVWNS